MPKELDKEEMSLYVYIKLCNILKYDQKYIFAEDFRYDREYDKNVRESNMHIKRITPENNKIICHDFNNIFVGILRGLGINASVWGYDHSRTEVQINETKITFDSTIVSAGKNDLLNAKLGERVEGVRFGFNDLEGKEKLDKIYQLPEFSQQKTMGDYINAFVETREKDVEDIEIDFDESMNFVLGELKKANMNGMSALLYMDILKKNKFFGEGVQFRFVGRREESGKYDRDIMVKRKQDDEEKYYLVNMEELEYEEYTRNELNRRMSKRELVYQDRDYMFEGIDGR